MSHRKQLREWRQNHFLSMRGMAKKLGMDHVMYWRIETGQSDRLQWKTAKRLGELTGLNYQQLQDR